MATIKGQIQFVHKTQIIKSKDDTQCKKKLLSILQEPYYNEGKQFTFVMPFWNDLADYVDQMNLRVGAVVEIDFTIKSEFVDGQWSTRLSGKNILEIISNG